MRTFISVFVGIISLALGLIPILNQFGVISFQLPFSIEGVFLAILMVIGAIILFVDATDASTDFVQYGSILSGFIVIVIGLGIIGSAFIPSLSFFNTVIAIQWVKEILLIISSIFLIIGGIMGY
jgi:hypothetical protein